MRCPLTLLTCLIGLAAGLWLASANARPTYTPLILDNPTPQAQTDTPFGFAYDVAEAGDVNGDGIPDVLVGAPNQDIAGNDNQGRAFVFSGGDGTLLLTFDHPTPQVQANFGRAVAGAEDVNGDGIPDLLVGAPGQDVGGIDVQGQAFVFSGGDGSLLLTLDHPTPQRFGSFGDAVAGSGDVNGDGIPDLLVGTPSQDVGGNRSQGRAFVLSGADGSRLLTLDNPTPLADARFGTVVATADDVDSDGVPDLLIGAPGQDAGGNFRQGRAFVLSGANGSLLLTLDNPTPQQMASFGSAVAGAGDVNGDGLPDLLVGARGQTVGANDSQGQAFVFSGVDGSLLLTLNHPAAEENAIFGNAVAGAGDVNADGLPDLLVGAPLQGGGAFVFSGADGSLLLTLDSPTPRGGGLLGYAVAAVGDVNLDGIPDLLVAAPGQDADGNLNQGQALLFVSSIKLVLQCPGDINGDGVAELVLVRGTGRVQVKDLTGAWVNDFHLAGTADLIDTELMPDTNANGAPELVAQGQLPATAEVRDLLTGAHLGTAAFGADFAPVDLEMVADQTGNGIPELVSLGQDPLEVEVRDGLTGTLVNHVGFTSYVIGKDLAIYPDLNGNGSPELAVLGDDYRQDDRADKIEIRDIATGAPVRKIWLDRNWRVLEQERIADVNGNGSEEVAVLRVHPTGNVNVQIRDTATSAWVNFVGFADEYPPEELVSISDINGNGADELVVFGRRFDGSNQKAVIKDTKTGNKLGALWFDRNFPGQDFVNCGDLNGNGAADLALVGQRASDQHIKVMVRDGRTGEHLAIVWF